MGEICENNLAKLLILNIYLCVWRRERAKDSKLHVLGWGPKAPELFCQAPGLTSRRSGSSDTRQA